MKNFSKYILVTFTVTAALFFNSKPAEAQQEQIKKFNTKIEVMESGKIMVKEEITYDFGANQRHGIFRNIPYTKTNQEGDSYVLNFDKFSVFQDNGQPHKFNVARKSSNKTYEIKIGDPDTYVTGEVFYEINYEVYGAMTYFESWDELFWNFTGDQWQIPILNSTNVVVVPNDIPNESIEAKCFTGKQGSEQSDCEINISGNTAIMTLNSTLQPGEQISGAIRFPKGYIKILEPEKDKGWIFGIILSLLIISFSIFWYIVFPIKLLLKRKKNKKFFEKNKRIVAAWFDPPKDDNNREFTPAEAGILIDKKPDQKEITATIIDLAKRGYMKIKKIEGDFLFEKKKDYENDDFLKEHERLILEGMFRLQDKVGVNELSTSGTFESNISKFYEESINSLEEKGLFEKDLSNQKDKFILLSVLGAITLNIPLTLVNILYRHFYIKFTKKGIEKYSETASLKNFLVSQDEKLDFQAEKMMFFEKLLPYATAFGVEKVWIERFDDLNLQLTDWYDSDDAADMSYFALSNSINRSVTKALASSSGSTSSSGFSSGFSGGGFSGGGGGGGGGGSW